MDNTEPSTTPPSTHHTPAGSSPNNTPGVNPPKLPLDTLADTKTDTVSRPEKHAEVDVSALTQTAAPFVAPKLNLLRDWTKLLPPDPPPAAHKSKPKATGDNRSKVRALILIGITCVVVVAGVGIGAYYLRSKSTVSSPVAVASPTPSATQTTQSKPDPGRTETNDGKKLDPTTNKLGASAYDNNKNIGYRDTGGDDSIQEYEDLLVIKRVGDRYINALGSRNDTAAWELLSSAEQAQRARQARYGDWYAEYLAVPFSTTSVQSNTAKLSWGSDQCLAKYDSGWAKKTTSAYYYTPSFQLISGITTQIQLGLLREGDTWKIQGENNLLINNAAVKRGDAYAKAQATRLFIDPKKCP